MKKLFLYFTILFIASCSNNASDNEENIVANITTNKTETILVSKIEQDENLPSKPVKYNWFHEFCNYSGNYDANKTTKETLDNTMEFLVRGIVPSGFSLMSVENLKYVDKEATEKEYDDLILKLKTKKFINSEYFNNLKQQRIKVVQRSKKLNLIKLESLENPEVLLVDEYSRKNCKEHVNALINGGNTLLDAWQKMAEERRDKGNKSAWMDYQEESKKADRELRARLEILSFGWWNCVNASIDYVDEQVAYEEFKKLFTDVKVECEEP